MGKFGAIKNVRQESYQQIETVETNQPVSTTFQPPTLITMKGRPTGKRSNPEFEPTTIFLRKSTKKMANRALEDSGTKQDLSELIEALLQGWMAERA